MSIIYYPQLASGAMAQMPYSTDASFLHTNNDMDCGVRFSYSWRTNPLSHFTLSYTSITDADLATLEIFFNSMNGKYGQFAFLDPAGNLVPNSESFASGAADPFGGTRAGVTTGPSATVLPSDANGITICVSIYVKGPGTWTMGFTGSTVLWETVGASSTWHRLYHSGVVSGSGAITASVSGTSATMFGFQCAPMMGPGAYVHTSGTSSPGYGYHATCRFDRDTFPVKYVGPNQNQVTLPVVEVGYTASS
jgi:hypothetical protein